MKIGILQTGRTPDELRAKHGDYDDLFKRMLGGRGFEFATYPALDGVLPESVNDADGWLITGSKFGAYEGHAWIAPLEDFLRRAYDAAVPIVGVCFGHQVLAQALGGKVEKYAGGWSVGAADYVGIDGRQDRILAWHQDQVTALPQGAEVIGVSDFCRYAMLSYGDRALSVQPHPEFTPEFFADLMRAKRDILPEHIASGAEARIGETLTSASFADMFEEFFKRNRSAGEVGQENAARYA